MKAFVENRKHRDKGPSAFVHSGRRRVEAITGNLGQTASRRSQVAQERKPHFLQWEDATLCEQRCVFDKGDG